MLPYVADAPKPVRSSEELRAAIPGWGADADKKDRPAVPRERFDPAASGAHWDFPERQEEPYPREKSIEHGILPPVFGTAQPLKGLSGVIRRYAYTRFSEGRAAHWLLLVAGDRVDAIESHLASFLTLRPDNPITETGVVAEFKHHGLRSRRGRVDQRHAWIDPILIAGPWVLAAGVGTVIVRSLLKRR
ncbi:MAG TPA: hypothetical protein VN200_02540 [Rhodoglobus sp.]|nr:hypothetical protein [Rhodoglobus sp.]